MASEKGSGTSQSFILFELANTAYALKSDVVQQMEMVEQITPVPNSPSFVDGVVFVRGQVVPVVNLRARFGFDRTVRDLRTRLMVVTHAGRTVGLLVDSAREFITVSTEAINQPPETITALSGRYLAGIASIGERLVLILDVAEVLNFQEIAAPTP
ncbi:Chemotaxis protein CheW [Anatilimnocola aggregata]|uniref:Chemotaxis protein CheW n=1 Tax=Anatilimnocola aggregata TaxID=2528021 RepID=A0A517YFA6_9BACT|nr:chemotaxis protein CheW [Anatilimnocola aggregata]QDU28914.1 Chemotaxis protein CheW [Anatilimnocola aggregata]